MGILGLLGYCLMTRLRNSMIGAYKHFSFGDIKEGLLSTGRCGA